MGIAASSIAMGAVQAPATATPAGHATTHANIHQAVQVVKAQKGEPYVYGANGPSAFDCSGLMEYAFGKAGVYLPRTSSDQSQYVYRISASQAHRGDFAFFYDSSGHVFHVVMVAYRHDNSGGQMHVLEAAHTGTNVRNAEIWSAPHFFGSLRRRHA